MEHQKALLARELHDELGGLLVGAVMDLAWVEQHITGSTPDVKQKLVRARQSLASAIDLKRKLIEELRPTLLDNVGLFAAMRWHVQAACKRAGTRCEIQVPDEEHTFLPNIPIVLFRIVQEALAVIVAPKPLKSAAFIVKSDGRHLTVDIRNDTAAEPSGDDADVHYFAAIEQRVAFLGGEFHHVHVSGSGAHITARFPLDKMLAPVTN
jgi:signal transduction histidine kinase